MRDLAILRPIRGPVRGAGSAGANRGEQLNGYQATPGRKPMNESPSMLRRLREPLLILVAFLLLVGLPVAVWFDMHEVTQAGLQRQASDLDAMFTSVRSYYANNIVANVQASPGSTQVSHDYQAIPGAIPIPATMSLELGRVIGRQQQNINYRFVSEYPFQGRAPHVLDEVEKNALAALRRQPHQQIVDVSRSAFSDRVRLMAPVIMEQTCVDCHNSHAYSSKHDWKVGDVRGIQEIDISQPIAANAFSFKYLLAYFVFMGAASTGFIAMQHRQSATIKGMNRELGVANEFLAALSMKISRYLSPQVYKSIFSGQKDVIIQTERKKLTIFFSDIKDFTATTERLQPELITQLLNEYFTEMSNIALAHGGTIDKFIGDAILIFFGDPETKGEAEDAKACLRMAADMQRKLAELNVKWRSAGIEHPFQSRMGINTGFCNVGNFGSADRMDYTIIGAEANLAARLQSIAEPGHIVISYETYALVRDMLAAHALPPITMKGISREVIPYSVEGMLDAEGQTSKIFSTHMTGLDFYLDPRMVNAGSAERIRAVLQQAIAALEKPAPGV
jgi:adenylate cyclase